MAKQTQGANIDIAQFQLFQIEFFLVGTSPLMPHAVSAKAKEMLLYPTGRKNAADRASSMKHEPFEEFREAAYQFRDADKSATRLYMPAGAFHAAIADAALDIIGATKTQIGRLTRIVGEKIPVWGIPQIASMIVVPSGMKRTPDVRTLPVLPAWCCKISVMFPSALIKPQSVGNLLGAAGIIIGVGDGRPQKGKKANGCWRVCSEDDEEWQNIARTGGIEAQDEALVEPAYFDRETETLLSWFTAERERRVAQPAKSPANKSKAKAKSQEETITPSRNGGSREVATKRD